MKRRIVFGLTTGGLLAGGGLGFAHADAAGTGSGDPGTTTGGSPGILSGNTIQIPVDVPINVCGVTANVVGLFNPAAGNHCENSGGATAGGTTDPSDGGATASGSSHHSPGILSGNTVQIPVAIPVNVCGDSVNGVGVGNAAKHNSCANEGGSATGGQGTGGATAIGGSHHSPGIGSGNTVQVPISIPVNACGDTVSVVGVGDVAKDDQCENAGGSTTGGATAIGGSEGSPGIVSGNTVQVPISIPVNVCGDTVSVVGVLDSAFGDSCANGAPSTPSTPPTPPGSSTPPPPPTSSTPGGPNPHTPGGPTPTVTGMLAHTGSDALMLAPVGAALVGGGAFLYRKSKPSGSH